MAAVVILLKKRICTARALKKQWIKEDDGWLQVPNSLHIGKGASKLVPTLLLLPLCKRQNSRYVQRYVLAKGLTECHKYPDMDNGVELEIRPLFISI
jgi:hypothetical protein